MAAELRLRVNTLRTVDNAARDAGGKELFAAKLAIGPQIDFCRCFGDMDATGREIALYPPGY